MAQKSMNFYNLFNKYKKTLFSLGIILIVLVFTNRLLLKDVVYESDDYKLHAVRTASYYLALKQGQLPVRWGPNLNGGYGYPSFNYMYHTPYFFGAVTHSFGFSVQESLNLTVLFSLLLGSLGCYFFIRSYLKSEFWSVLLSLSFILNPYTLLNIYWRGAVGELFFYAFLPFFLLGIKKLLKDNQKPLTFLLTTILMALLILSHFPSIFVLFILLIFFVLSEWKNTLSFRKIFPVICAVALGFLLSAWYWLPAYFEQWMVTYKDTISLTFYLEQFANPFLLFDIRKSSVSSKYFLDALQLGGVSILSLFVGLHLLQFSKKVRYWVVLIFLCIFLISHSSQLLWDTIKPLQYLQFPWRLISVITFASIMIFINFVSEKKIASKWKKAVAVLIAVYTLFLSQRYITSKGTTNRTDFDWYHPTFETGSSFNEHLPIWANLAYYFPDELLYVNASESALLAPNNLEKYVHKLSDLDAIITEFDGKTISYQISPDQNIIALHKRLFYPGWQALLDGKNVDFIMDVPEYQGILAVFIPNGSSNITVEFTGYTKLRRYTEIISVITLLFVVGQFILKKYRIK